VWQRTMHVRGVAKCNRFERYAESERRERSDHGQCRCGIIANANAATTDTDANSHGVSDAFTNSASAGSA